MVPAATAIATPIATCISQEAVHPSQACLGNALPTFVSAAAASNDVSATPAGPLDTGKRTSPDSNNSSTAISLAISGKIADTHIALVSSSVAPPALGQTGTTLTISPGPGILDNTDICADGQDMPGQGTYFYLTFIFLNSLNNI